MSFWCIGIYLKVSLGLSLYAVSSGDHVRCDFQKAETCRPEDQKLWG